jgi:hypothetical protein
MLRRKKWDSFYTWIVQVYMWRNELDWNGIQMYTIVLAWYLQYFKKMIKMLWNGWTTMSSNGTTSEGQAFGYDIDITTYHFPGSSCATDPTLWENMALENLLKGCGPTVTSLKLLSRRCCLHTIIYPTCSVLTLAFQERRNSQRTNEETRWN